MRRPRRALPRLRDWVAACALAEALGMTAAAGAARAGQAVVDDGGAAVAALGLVVAGGLVEGMALGTAQGWTLARWLPDLRRGRFLGATVVVAGLGWAAASAPGVLADGDGGAEPSRWLVLAGAAGLGLAMGVVLGAAQGWALPASARRAWVVANSVGWPPAMCVIFLGATAPGADWSLGAVLLAGVGTGLAAGAVLGGVTGRFLPRLAAT